MIPRSPSDYYIFTLQYTQFVGKSDPIQSEINIKATTRKEAILEFAAWFRETHPSNVRFCVQHTKRKYQTPQRT